MNLFASLNQRFTDWLIAPVPNAVGSLGIYRIVYCFFYLQYAAEGSLSGIATIPNAQWRPVPMLAWLSEIPSAPALEVAYVLLVVGLFMTLVGFYTRPGTLLVLLAGTFLSATRYSFNNMSHGDQYIVMYVPFFMFFVDWGKAYSIDALIQRKRGKGYDVHEGVWQHSWVYKAILLLLSVMFVMSAFIKFFYGEWLREFHLISDIVYAANLGANPNPFHSIIANTSVLYVPLEITAILFEGTFFLILLGLNWRRFYLATAVFFHVFNRNFVGPSTYLMVVVYGMFINWQLYLDRSGLMRGMTVNRFFDRFSVTHLRIAAILFVVIGTLTIQTPFVSKGIFNGIWVLEWVWWIATPIAAIGLGEALRQLWGFLTRTSQPSAGDGGIPYVGIKWVVAAVFLAVAWWLLRNTPRTEVYGNWWEFALLLITVYLAILMPPIVGVWLENRRLHVRLRHSVFILPIVAPLLLAAGWEVEVLREGIARPFNQNVFPIYEARFPQLPPVQVAALTDLKAYQGKLFDPASAYPDLKDRLDNLWIPEDLSGDKGEVLQRWYERRYPGSLQELDIDYLLVDGAWSTQIDEAHQAILFDEEHYTLVAEWEAEGDVLQFYAVIGEQYAPDHPFYDGRLGGTNRCVIYPHGDRLDVYALEGNAGVLAAQVTMDMEGEGVIAQNNANTVTVSRSSDGNIQITCVDDTGSEVHILADLAGTIIDQYTGNP